MTDQLLCEQAVEITALFPKLQRSLFVLDTNDPTIELPVAQLRVCAILRDGPRTMSALGRELDISLSAITQIADRLERAQLVERVTEGDDRRVKMLRLTPRAEDIMRARLERRINRVLHVLEEIPPEIRLEVVHALSCLLEASQASRSDASGALLVSELQESA